MLDLLLNVWRFDQGGAKGCGEAKVGNLGQLRGVDQDILGLEVAMHQRSRAQELGVWSMERNQPSGDLLRPGQSQGKWRVEGKHITQVAVLGIVQDEIDPAIDRGDAVGNLVGRAQVGRRGWTSRWRRSLGSRGIRDPQSDEFRRNVRRQATANGADRGDFPSSRACVAEPRASAVARSGKSP